MEQAGLPLRRVSFTPFEVDLHAGELRKHGVPVKLQAQPFRVLEMLLEHPGEVVSRDELKRRLWPAESFGDFDHGLNKSINKLREALGDSALTPRFIETVPRQGYRFVANVTASDSALDSMNWRHVPPELDGRPFRRFFAKVSPDGRHRLAHLHLMFAGADRWDQQIRFRDALRADPRLRDEYAVVKSRLATSFADDRERYTDEKAVFVKTVLHDLDAAGAS